MDDTIKKELYDIADYALAALTKAGASGAEVNISKSQRDEVNVDAGEFSLVRTTLGSSLNIRAIVGGKRGTAATNRHDRESIDAAVAAAIAGAESSEPDDAEIIADGVGEHTFTIGAAAGSLDKMFDRKQEFLAQVKAELPEIDVMQFVTQFNSGNQLYANTNGSRLTCASGRYSTSITFSAREGDNVTSMNGSGYSSHEFDTPILDHDFVRRALGEMKAQLHTVPVDGKFVGTLVAAPDCLSDFLNSMVGSIEDSSLISGTSPWKDKLGQTVADSRLNIELDPFYPRITAGSPYDGNGNLCERSEIIKDGVLVNFALSQYGSRKTGLPMLRAENGFIVGAGDTALDDIIAGIDDGLLINRFSGGSPAQNGDFSGVAKNSFLVKNGKITDAVSETMISGNLFEMLNNIVAISSDVQCDGGSVVPYAAFRGVTISGK
ncbi:MAG: TldD/PmbA family protein [Oscillospiraceae bacterium]|nr:TldD/PmbA family protein [Oscillospiraceae bacterium]